MTGTPREPTSDECSAKAVSEHEGRRAVAMWYPQMGGYVSHCLVVDVGGDSSCFDVFVWHDGDFPFHEGERPAYLHHCDPEQFARFGKDVSDFLDMVGE